MFVRGVTICACLAVVLVGHTSEGLSSEAVGGEVTTLNDHEERSGDVAAKLQALGNVVRRTPTSKVGAALQRGFTADLWQSWDREAATQKLDADGSLAVLNSYLTSDVENGNKVMHVMSWVKGALHSHHNSGDPQRLKLAKRVSELKERVSDTEQLAKATQSPAASRLAHKTALEMGAAKRSLEEYDRERMRLGQPAPGGGGYRPPPGGGDSKLQELKKVAAQKEAKAEKLNKELDDQKKEKEEAKVDDDASSPDSPTDSAKGSPEAEADAEKAAADAASANSTEAEEKINTVTSEDMAKAQARDMKNLAALKAKESSLKKKAKRLTKKAAEVLVKAKAEESDVSLLKLKAEKEKSEEKRSNLEKLIAVGERKLGPLNEEVEELTNEAKLARDAADIRLFDFKENVLVDAKQARQKNEALMEKEKKVLKDSKAYQAKMVKEEVESDDKIRLAQSTLKHAKLTNDPELVAKSSKLVSKANEHKDEVKSEVVKSGEAIEASALRLQGLARKQSAHISEDFKEDIHKAIDGARKIRKKARQMIRAHKVARRLALKQSKAAALQASATEGAAAKAKKKATTYIQKAKKIDKKAKAIAAKMDPILAEIAKQKKNIENAEAETLLAKESGEEDAIMIAQQKVTDAKTALKRAKKDEKALGKTPAELNEEADESRDKATYEDDIEHKANKAAEKFIETREAQLESADESQKEIENVKEVFLPKVLRGVHMRVAFIEHALAKQLSALQKLGSLQPTKESTAEDDEKDTELEKELTAQREASHMKVASLKTLRKRVNALRKKAEAALVNARSVEKKTQEADDKISKLRKEACGKAKQLQERLAKMGNENMKDLELETSRAQKACENAKETLTSARQELNKRAAAVADALAKARHLEGKYAEEDETYAAQKADAASKESVVDQANTDEDKQKLLAIMAMMQQAEGKKAAAKLMMRAAEKTDDEEAKETARAALAAAESHLNKLKVEKEDMGHTVKHDVEELGELHGSIKSDVLEISRDESKDDHLQYELGAEQSTAEEEATQTKMQQKVDALTSEVARQKQINDAEEEGERDQNVEVRAQMQKMKDKLDAIDKAAQLILKQLDEAINVGNSHNKTPEQQKAAATAAKEDIDVAKDQIQKLGQLKTSATDKVKAAEAAVAKNSSDTAAADALVAAKKDMAAVSNATTKVEEREQGDEQKLAVATGKAPGNKAADEAIGKFAAALKAKFEKLRQSTDAASERDLALQKEEWTSEASNNATNTRTLEDRITALEAAVEEFGGNPQSIEQGGEQVAKKHSGEVLQQKIMDEKQKLTDINTKINALDDDYKRASEVNDTHAQIKAGTEQKDLAHEAKNINATLHDLYGQIETEAQDVTAVTVGPDGLSTDPSAADPSAADSDTVQAANATQQDVMSKTTALETVQTDYNEAMKQAKDATDKRVDLMEKATKAQEDLKAAEAEESARLEHADKQKHTLSTKMQELSAETNMATDAVKSAKTKLTAMASALKHEEDVGQKTQDEAQAKIQDAQKTIDQNKLYATQTVEKLNALAADQDVTGTGQGVTATGQNVTATGQNVTGTSRRSYRVTKALFD